jgi:hypothetical protein
MNTESRERQDSRVSVRGTFRASLHRAFSCLLSGVCRSVFHLSRRAHIRIEFLNGSSAWRGLGRASPGRAAFRLGFFKRVVGLHQSPLCSRSNSMRHPNLPCYEHTGPFAFRCAALSNRGAGGRAALEIAWTRFSITSVNPWNKSFHTLLIFAVIGELFPKPFFLTTSLGVEEGNQPKSHQQCWPALPDQGPPQRGKHQSRIYRMPDQ